MSTHNLLPVFRPLAGALGALLVIAISAVPACSGGSEKPQENANVQPLETAQDNLQPTTDPGAATPDAMPAELPPIDAAAPKVTETATFASG